MARSWWDNYLEQKFDPKWMAFVKLFSAVMLFVALADVSRGYLLILRLEMIIALILLHIHISGLSAPPYYDNWLLRTMSVLLLLIYLLFFVFVINPELTIKTWRVIYIVAGSFFGAWGAMDVIFIIQNEGARKNSKPDLRPAFWFLKEMRNLKIFMALLLFGALFEWPYTYYLLLRFFMFLGFVFLSAIARPGLDQKGNNIVVVLCALLAILFNPLIPIHLNRATWAPIDIAVGSGLIIWAVVETVINRRVNQGGLAKPTP